MAFDEKLIGEINDHFLAGDNDEGVKQAAKILDDWSADYDTAISALALLRNHGMERDWAEWAAKLKARDFGVPTELMPMPFPYKEPFTGGPWRFERLGRFMRFGQTGSSLALNPVKALTLDDSGFELDRRFSGERVAWEDVTGGRMLREQTDKMADLVGLPGIRNTLFIDRSDGAPVKLDVSTCVREFEFPLQLLAALRTRIAVAD